ncbi:MAG: hypothetical protein ACN4G0_14070 [Polyangiales bacterium]
MFRFISAALARPLLAVLAVGFICGCGDAEAFKIRNDPWGETQPAVDWAGTLVELVHVTTPCDDDLEGLRALVGDHMEFENCAAASAKSACSSGSEAAVAIDVQARNIVYDFSNVASPGAFGRAEFNGYVVSDLLRGTPQVIEARLDREVTTLDLEDGDIVIDGKSVHVNLEGLAFTDTDFVKIDLVFADSEER